MAGSPRHTWRTSASFFAELARVRDRLPVYQGELYMEAHRGVLTSQAEYKRLYRACEVALQTHEALRVADGGRPLGEQAWLRVLFGQFHDALPGSSIARVYDDLEAEFALILSREEEATAAELANGGEAVAFNPVAVHRRVYLAERDLLLACRRSSRAAGRRPQHVRRSGPSRRVSTTASCSSFRRRRPARGRASTAGAGADRRGGLRLGHEDPHKLPRVAERP